MLDIREGDCREVMAQMEPASVDAIVTDPPYGLEFMGKEWDHGVPGLMFWFECLRVAKPGAHLVAFGGTRTYHRLACALEDAGWEIRDCLCWLYGSGFPKSLDVSKAIDKALGAEREKVRTPMGPTRNKYAKGLGDDRPWMQRAAEMGYHEHDSDEPATVPGTAWQGWGTALKPAWEPIILARKPLAGTVAANVQAHGTGALNVDGCRVGTTKRVPGGVSHHPRGSTNADAWGYAEQDPTTCSGHNPNLGRWPANVVLDEDAARMLDEQSGELTSGSRKAGDYGRLGYEGWDAGPMPSVEGDSGGASRFFYTAKAASSERHYAGKNTHPTVKPVDLMRWLCRLVTPPGGLILDPFCGSGSTGVAALAEGFRFIGIELDSAYVELARKRIAGPLFAAEGLRW